MMLEAAQFLAITAAGIWTGAAIYIGFAEHPSAVKTGPTFATEYFRHMSKRTAPFMMVLAALSGMSAGWVWWINGDNGWLIGASLQLGMFPLTGLLIVPTNIKLIQIDPAAEPELAARLHSKWGRMHWLRTAIGGLSFPLFLWLLPG